MAAITTSADLVAALGQLPLLDPAQLDEMPQLQGRLPDATSLAAELVRRGWLTAFQRDQLLEGKTVVLGAYALLDKLGEGGMGAVFKARNWKLGKVVALKVIRKERLDSDDALRRFHREIRAAAKLNHPNVVHAFDADQVGGTHLLVMEYVEGTDLHKLVKQTGPLPIAQACDYIRQTAMGLQHAFEQGIISRDIKPHNLLVALPSASAVEDQSDGAPVTPMSHEVVKILDLGLARITNTSDASMTGTTMTKEGSVMGTPDYMAPEQAMEAHDVDIRADLYSLGCTLYFLLTGKTPFAAKIGLTDKLMAHQFDEAPLLESMRPDVPAGVSAIVRKLLAKKPEDRYQTPSELAAVLADGLRTGEWAHAVADDVPMATPVESSGSAPGWSSGVTPSTKPASSVSARMDDGLAAGRRLVAITSAAGIVLAAVIGVVGYFVLRPSKTPSGPARPVPVVFTVAADKGWQDAHVDVEAGQSVKVLVSGKWRKQELTPCGDEGVRKAELDKVDAERLILPKQPPLGHGCTGTPAAVAWPPAP